MFGHVRWPRHRHSSVSDFRFVTTIVKHFLNEVFAAASLRYLLSGFDLIFFPFGREAFVFCLSWRCCSQRCWSRIAPKSYLESLVTWQYRALGGVSFSACVTIPVASSWGFSVAGCCLFDGSVAVVVLFGQTMFRWRTLSSADDRLNDLCLVQPGVVRI
jgi:hypothetical protein